MPESQETSASKMCVFGGGGSLHRRQGNICSTCKLQASPTSPNYFSLYFSLFPSFACLLLDNICYFSAAILLDSVLRSNPLLVLEGLYMVTEIQPMVGHMQKNKPPLLWDYLSCPASIYLSSKAPSALYKSREWKGNTLHLAYGIPHAQNAAPKI